jgi:hypothetical protein
VFGSPDRFPCPISIRCRAPCGDLHMDRRTGRTGQTRAVHRSSIEGPGRAA